jgi:hypothetical protein
MTGWAMLALEGGGVNPLDARSGGETPISYLKGEVDRLRSVGDLERTVLALVGAGINPRAFAGEDLVANLRERRDGDGSVDGQVNLTAFYVLAMRAAGIDQGSLGKSVKWLRRAQNSDGGWGIQPKAPSEADSTGAALQALVAAGAAGGSADDGARWLRRAQQRGGGWPLGISGVVNAQSTAWAIQGLVAVGSGSDDIDRGLTYLARLRNADGHYSYSASSDQTPIWVTGQVILATHRKAFPLAVVARQSQPARDNPNRGGGSSQQPSQPNGGGSQPASGGSGGDGGNGGSTKPAAEKPDRQRGGEPAPAEEAATTTTPAPAPGDEGLDAIPLVDNTLRAPVPPDDDSGATVPLLIVGFTALAAALVGGFLWYRRRLP